MRVSADTNNIERKCNSANNSAREVKFSSRDGKYNDQHHGVDMGEISEVFAI